MLTSDKHTDDLRTYLKSLTEAVDTAATNREVPASSGGRRRWPVVAGAAAVVLAVLGALALLGMDDRQSVSTADDGGEVDVPDGWRTVEYGDVTFDVPPGWVEQEPSPCDLRVNVRGYYLLPIRAEGPGGGGCASPAEHWDNRDTLMLHLLPSESTYPVPSDAETIVTDGGLEGFSWNKGERHTEYYFPNEHLRAGVYRSLDPEVDPASVVATLRPRATGSAPAGGPATGPDCSTVAQLPQQDPVAQVRLVSFDASDGGFRATVEVHPVEGDLELRDVPRPILGRASDAPYGPGVAPVPPVAGIANAELLTATVDTPIELEIVGGYPTEQPDSPLWLNASIPTVGTFTCHLTSVPQR